jgi:cytosine/adenosine deaminase-related metal-dependent hydrolase
LGCQVIKIRRALSRQEVELSVREGVRISLAAGTTAIGEILTDSSIRPLYDTFPLSGRIFFEAIGQESSSCTVLQGKLEQLLHSYHGGNFLPGLSPHAPHTLSPAFFRDIVQLARAESLPHAVHLSESPAEAAFMHDSSGGIAELLYPLAHWEGFLPRPMHTTSTAYLDSLGVLDFRTIAVHCVQITPADAELLKQREVRVVICPRSNDKLAVGQPPLHLLKKTGIPLALGTDSLASNESLSLWDEMRFLLDQNGSPFSAAELLRMASLGAAEVLGIQASTGSLEPGKRADFLVVEPGAIPSATGICQSLIEKNALQQVYIAGQPITMFKEQACNS